MSVSLEEKYLSNTIAAIVDFPEEIEIVRSVDNMGILLTLTVAQKDLGKVIGREGATINSIRTVLRVVGMKNNARVSLKVNERSHTQFRTDDNLDISL